MAGTAGTVPDESGPGRLDSPVPLSFPDCWHLPKMRCGSHQGTASAVFAGPRAGNEGHESKGRRPVFSRRRKSIETEGLGRCLTHHLERPGAKALDLHPLRHDSKSCPDTRLSGDLTELGSRTRRSLREVRGSGPCPDCIALICALFGTTWSRALTQGFQAT